MISAKLQFWSWLSLLPRCPCWGWPSHLFRYVGLEASGIVLFPLFRFCSVQRRFCSVITPGYSAVPKHCLSSSQSIVPAEITRGNWECFPPETIENPGPQQLKIQNPGRATLLFHSWGWLLGSPMILVSGTAGIGFYWQALSGPDMAFLELHNKAVLEKSPKYCLQYCKVFDFI